MCYSALLVQCRYWLGSSVFPFAGMNSDDAAFEPRIFQCVLCHIAALVGFDDDRISLMFVISEHHLFSPASRRVFPSVISID